MTCRPPQTCPLVLAVLQADASPIGMTHAQLMVATGLDATRTSAAMRLLKLSGRCFSLGKLHDSRYFASAERMEACRPAHEAFVVELKAARKARKLERERITERAYYARLKAEGRLPPPRPKKPKPPAAAKAKPTPKKPKPAKQRAPAPVLMQRGPCQKPKPRIDGPVIVPAHVRVQVCPCGKDTRFSVPPNFVGELSREWKTLRSSGRGSARTTDEDGKR